jgi:hypothetical protein
MTKAKESAIQLYRDNAQQIHDWLATALNISHANQVEDIINQLRPLLTERVTLASAIDFNHNPHQHRLI